jgi:hypothetical protein
MKIKKSITLTEQEFYTALREYVERETGMVMPADMNSIVMLEQDAKTVLLEWEIDPVSHIN